MALDDTDAHRVPTHMYVLAPDHMWYLTLRPEGIDHVHVRFGLAVAPETYEALGDKRQEWLDATLAFSTR